ncbi:MAG: hypothetical protein H0X40_09620 [Chthoniobacterales bacterium]|nr:hypothetical protein [Chthoniobacterales bacterium]
MDLSVNQLQKAVSIRQQIDHLQSQLNSLLGGSGGTASAPTGARKGRPPGSAKKGNGRKRRGTISAAGRARIAAAARARWARKKAGATGGSEASAAAPAAASTKTAAKKTSGKKRGLSAAGRKRLSQMMKARWAARRKAQGK